jgi:hypothetical protein
MERSQILIQGVGLSLSSLPSVLSLYLMGLSLSSPLSLQFSLYT